MFPTESLVVSEGRWYRWCFMHDEEEYSIVAESDDCSVVGMFVTDRWSSRAYHDADLPASWQMCLVEGDL